MSKLPQGWAHCAIHELIGKDGVFSDGDWIESKDQDPNGKNRLLQLADIGDGFFVDKSNRFVNDEQFKRLRCTEVIKDDVLVARMPDPLGRACLMPKLGRRCLTVVDVAIIRPGIESVHPNWLMHCINSPNVRSVIQLESTGTTRKRISRGKLSEIELPVPPLAEQKRIADKLDTVLARVDSTRARLDRIPALLKRFRQSVLAAATSGALTEEWRGDTDFSTTARFFEEIAADTLIGLVRSSAEQSDRPVKRADAPYVKMNNINNDWGFNKQSLVFVTTSEPEKCRFALRDGDWLFNTRNSVELVGKSCIWQGGNAVFNNNLMRVRFVDCIEPKYVEIWFRSPVGQAKLAGLKSATTSVAAIYQRSLMAIQLDLPPLEEQREIVRRVESLFAIADRIQKQYEAAKAKIDRLAPALLAKAFRGELVPQDLRDEPVSVMLERLRASKDAMVKPVKKRPQARGQ